jgi:hypothetical protein
MKTIPISDEAHKVWRGWCKKKSVTSEVLMDELQKAVLNKQREVFYLSLPKIDTRRKALENVKIKKNYKNNSGVQ